MSICFIDNSWRLDEPWQKSWHLSAQIELSSCFNLPREYVGYCSVIAGWKMCMFDAWGGKKDHFAWSSIVQSIHGCRHWPIATNMRFQCDFQMPPASELKCPINWKKRKSLAVLFAFDESAFLWRVRNTTFVPRGFEKKTGKTQKIEKKFKQKNALSTCPKKVKSLML